MNAQRRFFATLFLTAALVSSSACVCVITPSNKQRGDVTFLWTFGGQHCAVVRDVAQVTISIPGQTLMNSGSFACNTAGTDGITLLDFAPGNYTFTIEGRSNSGVVLYSSTGTFAVNGSVTVNADLKAETAAVGTALITWKFPANGASATPDCSVAGVQWVDITIDTQAPQRVTCVSGFMTQGVQISNLAVGTHTIDLKAADSSGTSSPGTGFVYYGVRNTITVMAGATVANEFSLGWAVGTLALKWQFFNNTIAQTCSQAGVTTVYVNLKDSTGTFLFTDNGGTGKDFPCVDAQLNQGVVLPTYFYPGTYQVYIQASGSGGAAFSSNQTTPPGVQVTAGTFPTLAQASTISVNYP